MNQEIFDFYKRLDRSFFIDNEYKEYAHCDQALPIGFEQTISQPSLVLEMTLQLDLAKTHRVLEIGTGSGYQTALLAEFVKEVFTIERLAELSSNAQKKLKRLGYKNIKFKIGDGSNGWEEFAPYDRIIVTAGANEIPQALAQQLKSPGKMIIPVGEPGLQDLLIVEKDANNNLKTNNLGKVRFVELKGEYGWQ